ncbi:MAG: nickel-dependent hydrogenase large subunit [bacterium]
MHQTFDLSLDGIAKVEGSCALDLKVRNGKVKDVKFMLPENKRFFTNAIKGKPLAAIPQLLARICGTCSSAHLMCSIEASERALGIEPSAQTMMLRHLTMYGLNIRDHALHLYLFVMPDLYGKDSFLDFDENDKEEHQLLHDAFEIKAAGNYLATIISGRAVHAQHPTIGGFLHFPTQKEVNEAIKKLELIRPAVLRLIKIYEEAPFHFDWKTNYMGLVSKDHYGFLEGEVVGSAGEKIAEADLREHLEHVVLPYSMGSAYKHEGESYMVGALARINVSKDLLHASTKKSLGKLLNRFPSTDIFDNNLAQAIEILHSVDHALELMKSNKIKKESIINKKPTPGVGVAVIEAPRGLLYHKIEIDGKGIVKEGEIVVPTGQNQINIEESIFKYVESLLPTMDKKDIPLEIEKLIRAYDPCTSCATHFLKVKWV